MSLVILSRTEVRNLPPMQKAAYFATAYEELLPAIKGKGDRRDLIGRLIGISGRTISRYLRLARIPTVAQRAHNRGRVRLIDAERISSLTAEQQAHFAALVNEDKMAEALALVGGKRPVKKLWSCEE
jgi:ParB family transcriptional regulator, chromosome partitioning protein